MDSSVDPGMGFGEWDDERYIHIIPMDDNDVEVLYVKTKVVPKKILGFIPSQSKVNKQFSGENLTNEQTEEIIRAYFVKNERAILELCNK